MLKTRVIPCLLIDKGGLVKTTKFADPKYVGDPINAVRIFNDKGADELVLLDIGATREGRPPDFTLLQDIANEAFMPMAYGGGLTRVEDVQRILRIGYEKVVINTAAVADPSFLRKAADVAGSQSVVASLDVRKGMFGRYEVRVHGGTKGTGLDPADHARRVADAGAGEIILNAIDRDGTQAGYDVDLIRKVTAVVNIPVVALGGAGSLAHFAEAVRDGGAAAVAAGSFFVFHGKHRAVLISYPDRKTLGAAFDA